MITAEKITTTDVKRLNKNRIFRLIHYTDKISRQEIAEILQLSLPTVNQNLKLLTNDGLIEFEGNFESTGGRKAQAIIVKGMSKCAISVNLSSTGVKVALVNLKGEIICSEKATVDFSDNARYIDTVAGLVEDIVNRNDVNHDDILGVGITVPGIFDTGNEIIISAPTMGIRNYPVSAITSHIPYRCIAMNDAKANSYAEYWFGRENTDTKKVTIEEFNRHLMTSRDDGKLYLMLNTGVGGSYISNERIMHGKHNRYGEFGHMTLHPQGKLCTCGKRGCLEAYVSARLLSEELGITLTEFFSRLENGDEGYKAVFDEYIDNLTTGINNLYIMCDGDIILGGPVAHFLKKYETIIKQQLIKKYCFDTDASYLSFATCTVEQSDTGAALIFLGEFIRGI